MCKKGRVAGGCYNWNNSHDSYVSKNVMKENICLKVCKLRFLGIEVMGKTETKGVVTAKWIKGSRQRTDGEREVTGAKVSFPSLSVPPTQISLIANSGKQAERRQPDVR